MQLKDIGYGIADLARLGLVVSRRMIEKAGADERELSPERLSRLVSRLHPRRIRARVSEVIVDTASTKTLRLVPAEGPFPAFRAGQFVNLFLTVDGVATSRPYSIASSPTRTGILDITVRKMPGGFVSPHLCDEVEPGDVFEITGPSGCSYHEPLTDTESLVFLCGGCGITAFISQIRMEAELRRGFTMHLIYGSRVPDDVIYHDELTGLTNTLDTFKMDLVISEPPKGYKGHKGFLDAKMIKKLVGDVEGKTFFLCGPQAMYDLCTTALRDLGVPDRRVKMELPGPPPDITTIDGWPEAVKGDDEVTLSIDGTGKTFKVRCGEPLLNALERNGEPLDALCRSGECGHCRVRLLAGDVFIPPSVTRKRSDVVFGYIHTCMAYPLADVRIRF